MLYKLLTSIEEYELGPEGEVACRLPVSVELFEGDFGDFPDTKYQELPCTSGFLLSHRVALVKKKGIQK